MARPLRVEYPGAFYHVTSRGVAQQTIFFDDQDRERFLDLLGCVHDRYGFVFHCYCLMDNHYHLEIETPYGNLSRGMQWLAQTYASAVNRRHNRAGHLFQGRFKSAVVDKDVYVQALTRYVHLNPVRAKLVEHPGDYKWSSYRAYLGVTRSPAWLETKETLMLFGSVMESARRDYRRFVEGEVAQDPMRELSFGFALGREAFVERMRKMLTGGEQDSSVSDVSRLKKATRCSTVQEVAAIVCKSYKIEKGKLQIKWGRDNEARDIAVYLSSRLCAEGLREIGAYFGALSVPAASLVCRKARERINQDKKFGRRVRAIESEIKNKL